MGRSRARHVPVVDLVRRVCPNEDVETLVAARRVQVDGVLITNTRAQVRQSAAVRVLPAGALRGSIKLQAALDLFAVDVAGRVALDLGAAAGGFTSALIEAGARLVYAVDVGHGQLLGRLRVDDRVVNLESTNLADLDRRLVPDTVEIVTADLSYLPAGVGVRQLHRLTYSADADLVWLVKPTFELGLAAPSDDSSTLSAAGAHAAKAMASEGWRVLATVQSPVRGRHGTIELFIHARRDERGSR